MARPKFRLGCLPSFDRFARWELKNYWEDGCTVECRYFYTKAEAKEYAKNHGFVKYKIVPNQVGNPIVSIRTY